MCVWSLYTDLLHPTRGGTAAHKAKTQVIAQQAIAWFGLKTKFPSGLQTTSHLSNATTARDHRLTIPATRRKRYERLTQPLTISEGADTVQL